MIEIIKDMIRDIESLNYDYENRFARTSTNDIDGFGERIRSFALSAKLDTKSISELLKKSYGNDIQSHWVSTKKDILML